MNHPDHPWLDGYDLPKLNELYAIGEPIKETTEEQYRSYFEFANNEYNNFQVLEKHKGLIKELLVNNFGNVKYNGLVIPSTLVADGPNKGVDSGKIDHYREILFPDLPINRYVFKTYRLVAEVWCNNHDPKIYTTVHHIGNDSFDNKSNLLFVTQEQHLAIRHVKPKSIREEEARSFADKTIPVAHNEKELDNIFIEAGKRMGEILNQRSIKAQPVQPDYPGQRHSGVPCEAQKKRV